MKLRIHYHGATDRRRGRPRPHRRLRGFFRLTNSRGRLRQGRRLILARLGWAPSLGKRLVLVDQLVHVRSKHVLAVLVDVLLVNRCPEDGRAAGGAAADAHACEQLQARDDGHREAPAADGLAAQPSPEKTRKGGVDQRDDTADAGQALDARKAGARNSPCRTRCLRTRRVALRRLRARSGTASSAGPRTAARDDPIKDDDATQDTADCGIRRVWRAAAHYRHGDGRGDSGQWCVRNPGKGASNTFGGASEAAPNRVRGPSHRLWSLAEDAECLWHQGDEEDEAASDSSARHVFRYKLPEQPLELG